MKFKLCIVAQLLLMASAARASLTINAELVKKSVVFIYPADATGAVEDTKPMGTGFFVSVPYKDRPGGYLMLITARHVLDPAWAGCPRAAFTEIYLRLNLSGYDPGGDKKGVEFVAVDLTGKDKSKEFQSTDVQVDAAVVVLHAQDFVMGKYDISAIPIREFATADELSGLGTGDEVISAGLLPGVQGEKRNYPVFKFGAISNIMDEPFVTECTPNSPVRVSEKAWLLSVNLFPGASGSAIFYTPPGSGGVQFGARVNRPVLIGVQSSSVLGADISAMTPIELVVKIINEIQLPDADLFRGVRGPAPAQVPMSAPGPAAPPH